MTEKQVKIIPKLQDVFEDDTGTRFILTRTLPEGLDPEHMVQATYMLRNLTTGKCHAVLYRHLGTKYLPVVFAPIQEGALYKHEDGALYRVIAVSNESVERSDWLPPCVTYRSIDGGRTFTRPLIEFLCKFTLSIPAHSTWCTYNWELAFLNLEDSPAMRKLYWSALGAIKFDARDQVCVPQPDTGECPACALAEGAVG